MFIPGIFDSLGHCPPKVFLFISYPITAQNPDDVDMVLVTRTYEFTKYVLVANIAAWPAAYFALDKWLQNFAYRTNINIIAFILCCAIAVIIAMLTVSFQALRVARANPVESLRNE